MIIHNSLCINGEEVEKVSGSVYYWGPDLELEHHLSLRQPSRGCSSWGLWGVTSFHQRLLSSFYRCTIKSILTYCCTVWYFQQRVVKTAERIIGSLLPNLCDIYSNCLLTRDTNIQQDPSHPGSPLFAILPSGRLRTPGTCTNRLRNSFSPMSCGQAAEVIVIFCNPRV